MSNFDKSLNSIIRLQESINRMAQNPFESLIKQQEQMLRDFTVRNQLIGSMKPANQLVDQFQHQLTLGTTPPLAIVSDLLARYSSLTEPIQRIANQGIDSTLLSLHNSLANDSIQQQMKNIQNNLSSFSLAFESIVIHDNYVDMPEALIPDDYNYTGVDCDITHAPAESLPGSTDIKKLSIPDAINVICSLITLLFAIITFLQNQQSSIQQQKNHEEIVRLEQHQIALQQKENELLQLQIDATEKNTKYLMELLNQLQETDEDSPVTPSPVESALSDIGSCPQYDPLQVPTDESDHSTGADDSHNSDTPQQPE